MKTLLFFLTLISVSYADPYYPPNSFQQQFQRDSERRNRELQIDRTIQQIQLQRQFDRAQATLPNNNNNYRNPRDSYRTKNW